MLTMKKIISSFICFSIFFILSPAFADDCPDNSTNWGIQTPPPKTYKSGETSETTWNREQQDNIEDNYGSIYSPAFLNRENINPDESEYNYGSSDGIE